MAKFKSVSMHDAIGNDGTFDYDMNRPPRTNLDRVFDIHEHATIDDDEQDAAAGDHLENYDEIVEVEWDRLEMVADNDAFNIFERESREWRRLQMEEGYGKLVSVFIPQFSS
jgi:hypothetical protein